MKISIGNDHAGPDYKKAIVDFLTKKEVFKNSHLELNRYFHNLEFWRKEDIEKRAEYLANICLKIWIYFGDESQQSLDDHHLTSSKPQSLFIYDKEYSVKTWRDVLEVTLNTIAEAEADQFQEIIEKFPRFIGWDEKSFRENRKLKNGAFINVNLSAKDIYKFCLKVKEFVKLEEWEVKTE